jgi:hypothetical protein
MSTVARQWPRTMCPPRLASRPWSTGGNMPIGRGISASEKPRARQAAFQRASEHLVGAQAVGIWDEQVWLTRYT